jgi:hypothetical protein
VLRKANLLYLATFRSIASFTWRYKEAEEGFKKKVDISFGELFPLAEVRDRDPLYILGLPNLFSRNPVYARHVDP